MTYIKLQGRQNYEECMDWIRQNAYGESWAQWYRSYAYHKHVADSKNKLKGVSVLDEVATAFKLKFGQ